MILAWNDIRSYPRLNRSTKLAHRVIEAHGIDGVIKSDQSGWPRLALLYVLVVAFEANFRSCFMIA